MNLRAELTMLLNRHSRENSSNTPDFILAEYMENCLLAFESAVSQRERWYGRQDQPGAKRNIDGGTGLAPIDPRACLHSSVKHRMKDSFTEFEYGICAHCETSS